MRHRAKARRAWDLRAGSRLILTIGSAISSFEREAPAANPISLPGRNFQCRHGPNALNSHQAGGYPCRSERCVPSGLLLKEQAMVRVGDKVPSATLYMMGSQGPK